MWIKTPQGKLVNLEKVSAVQFATVGGKEARTVVLNVEGIQVAVSFETGKDAQEFVDKLAKKFGAVEI